MRRASLAFECLSNDVETRCIHIFGCHEIVRNPFSLSLSLCIFNSTLSSRFDLVRAQFDHEHEKRIVCACVFPFFFFGEVYI